MYPDSMLKDALTGAYSRAVLQHRLQEEAERARRYGEDFSILFLDLDHFKSINDAFGHARGDQLLIGFVESLRSMIRSSDILIRYGGDEFILLLPNTDMEQAMLMAQRLLDDILKIRYPGNPPLSLSLSIGVASFPQDGDTAVSLFDQADLRMYDAKRRGRGRVVGQSSTENELLPFDDTCRLVEREEALSVLYSFIRQLGDQKRGRLMITGCNGSGKSRFLVEASKAARLHGYEVVTLLGSHAMATRPYGVLTEAFREWSLPSPFSGTNEFIRALQALLESRGRSGLFLCAEQMTDFDWATLELFHHLFVSSSIPRLALAYTHSPENSRRIFLPEAPLTDTIEVRPLSKGGLHIWMRSLTLSEPEPRVLDWLYEMTQGKPGFVQKSLYYLVDRGALKRTGQGWTFEPGFEKLISRESLPLQSSQEIHNLPIPPTNFLGRDKEIQYVKDLLKEKRLVTLSGPGGIGKTRLALQVAYEVLDQFPQGVFFVPLASIQSPDLLVSTIAEQVRFTFYSQEEPIMLLINFLREKHMLLVLDNFEHIIRGAGTVIKILEYTSRLKILATSRECLNLQGESILELKGLPVPKNGASQPLEVYSGVQLFLMYARQVQPDFQLTEEDRQYVARICQLLEGLPLGIELAATWVRILSCKEIATEIEQNIDFLVTQLRDIPDRHRSLRAVFEQSWYLLTETERDILRRFSIFPGGFRRETSRSVAGASLVDLSTLVNKSLLYKSGTGRYMMHEVLHKYAAEKLEQAPEEKEKTQDKFCAVFADFLQQKQGILIGKKQKEALEEIQEELSNIRHAWDLMIEKQQLERIDQALYSLFSFYEIRGLFFEGLYASQKAAHMLQEITSSSKESIRFEDVLLGKLLCWEGVFHVLVSKLKKAKELFDLAYPLLKRWEAKPDLAFLRWKMSLWADGVSDYQTEIQFCNEGLDLYQECGDMRGKANVLNQMGVISYHHGDYHRAESFFQEYLDISKQIEDLRGIAIALINLGAIASELGEREKATERYQQSLEICKELGDKISTAILLNNLGDSALIQNQLEKAKTYLEDSARIYTELGDQSGLATPIFNLGEIALKLGEYEQARQLFEQSLMLSNAAGNQVDQGYCLARLGMVASLLEDIPVARENLIKALRVARSNSSIPMILEVLIAVASLFFHEKKEGLAFRILSVILRQPEISADIKGRASALYQKYESFYSNGIIGAADQAGADSSLEKTLTELTEEFEKRA